MKIVAPHDRPRQKARARRRRRARRQRAARHHPRHGRPRAGALELANAVLNVVGGLHGPARASTDDLRRVRGSAGAPSQLIAAVEAGRRTLLRVRRDRQQVMGARDVAEFLVPQFGTRPVEQFGVVLLDTKHRFLRTTLLSVGTLDTSIVHPREVFRAAASAGAAALVLFHNHPSGDPTPSEDDVALTRRMVRAGELMGISVLDHVIVAENRFCSLQERGDLLGCV